MPGKQVPARDPGGPSLARELRDLRAAITLLDRRMPKKGDKDWLYQGPDNPGLNSGKGWLRPRKPTA